MNPVTTSPLDIIEETLEILSEPDSWVQDYIAKDDSGTLVEYYDRKACQFCLTGAISRAVYNLMPPEKKVSYILSPSVVSEPAMPIVRKVVKDAIGKVTGVTDNHLLISFNDDDDTTHDKVIEVLKIAKEELC